MGYVLIEYMIFEGDDVLLNKLRTKIIKILKKNKDLSTDLIGNVHTGANGQNSLILHPHGWNGGWFTYKETLDDIKDAFDEVNYDEHKRHLKSKDIDDYEQSIYLTTFSRGDSGYKVQLENLAESLRSGVNPSVGFIDFNGKYGKTVKAVEDEFAAHMEKLGTEDWEAKKRKIATKMVELEELKPRNKKKT